MAFNEMDIRRYNRIRAIRRRNRLTDKKETLISIKTCPICGEDFEIIETPININWKCSNCKGETK